MHGRQHNKNAENAHWRDISLLLLLTLAILLIMHFSRVLTGNNHIVPIIGLSNAIIFSLITSPLCLLLARHFANPWKAFFLLMGIENIIRFFIALEMIIALVSKNSAALNFIRHSINITYTLFLPIRPIYWSIFLIYAIKQHPFKLKMITPALPMAFTIFFSITYISLTAQQYQTLTHTATFIVLNLCYVLLVFLLLIYSLPIAKKGIISIMTCSFVIIILGDIAGRNLNFTVPHFDTLQPAHFFWNFGYLLLIYTLIKLFKKKNQNVNTWFYSVDSIHAQISYWGNSIASTLFLLLSITYITFSSNIKVEHFILHVNSFIFIILITLLSLITLFFSRRFTKDFSKISFAISKMTHQKEPRKTYKNLLYFAELHQLYQFIIEKMNLATEKTKHESQIYAMATEISNKMQGPITILSDLSDKFSSSLDEKQQHIYKKALTRIDAISEDLLSAHTTRQDIADDTAKNNYVYIYFNEIIQEKILQCERKNILLEMKIDRDAIFIISPLPDDVFYRLLSNIINNAIEACESRQNRIISCYLQHTPGENYFQVSVKDSGCGMHQEQINTILKGESKTTKEKGFGIGLRYVINTVSTWKGNCKIKSKIDKGTEFCISLPLSSPKPHWWADSISVPDQGDIIIFSAGKAHYDLLTKELAPVLEKTTTSTIKYCYRMKNFIRLLTSKKDKFILFDATDSDNLISTIDYIKKYSLEKSALLITQRYHEASIQHLCEQSAIKLIPETLFKYVKINIARTR